MRSTETREIAIEAPERIELLTRADARAAEGWTVIDLKRVRERNLEGMRGEGDALPIRALGGHRAIHGGFGGNGAGGLAAELGAPLSSGCPGLLGGARQASVGAAVESTSDRPGAVERIEVWDVQVHVPGSLGCPCASSAAR